MTLEALWFWLLALMLATYVVLDGFDLGVGVLHLFVARTQAERDVTMRSIGPVWDGNEVWLIAAGATMFFAFPTLLATAFSGFYLPLMVALWLLVFRALSIELRHQLDDAMWRQIWDVAFAASSLLLAVVIGAGFANVYRGVPLGEDGTFFEPLWTNFRVGAETGILDWFTLLVGVTAAVALAQHGALWLAWRTGGQVQRRARRWELYVLTFVLTLLVMTASIIVRPDSSPTGSNSVVSIVLAVLAIVSLIASGVAAGKRRDGLAFLGSAGYLYATILWGAASLTPNVLAARDPAFHLTIESAASPDSALRGALFWWIPGMALVLTYTVIVYRTLPERISAEDSPRHE